MVEQEDTRHELTLDSGAGFDLVKVDDTVIKFTIKNNGDECGHIFVDKEELSTLWRFVDDAFPYFQEN